MQISLKQAKFTCITPQAKRNAVQNHLEELQIRLRWATLVTLFKEIPQRLKNEQKLEKVQKDHSYFSCSNTEANIREVQSANLAFYAYSWSWGQQIMTLSDSRRLLSHKL